MIRSKADWSANMQEKGLGCRLALEFDFFMNI